MYSLNGWTKAVFDCIQKLGKKEFELKELYDFKSDLKKVYPFNNHIEQKIQQQVQILKKEKFLQRLKRGQYSLTQF
jgi:hypothetical protein